MLAFSAIKSEDRKARNKKLNPPMMFETAYQQDSTIGFARLNATPVLEH